jgi:hypothetical protein
LYTNGFTTEGAEEHEGRKQTREGNTGRRRRRRRRKKKHETHGENPGRGKQERDPHQRQPTQIPLKDKTTRPRATSAAKRSSSSL